MPSAPRPHTIRVPRALLRGSSWLRGPGCARAPVPPMLEFCSEQAIGAHSGDSTAKAWHLLLTWVWLHSPSKLPCSFYQLPWQYAGHDCLLFPRGLQKGKGGEPSALSACSCVPKPFPGHVQAAHTIQRVGREARGGLLPIAKNRRAQQWVQLTGGQPEHAEGPVQGSLSPALHTTSPATHVLEQAVRFSTAPGLPLLPGRCR